MVSIKLTPEQEALLNEGTCIEGKWYFLPFWFEKVKDGAYIMHHLGMLPKELVQLIESQRRGNSPYFEIWMEGYSATGEHGTANRVWAGQAKDFDHAVVQYLNTQTPEFVKDYYQKREDGTHTIWACQLFDNEIDARKSFG